MSDSGMPFARNPAKMVGQLLRLWPLTARDSASCWISSARTVDYLRFRGLKMLGKVAVGRAKNGPRWAPRARRSGEHFAGFNRLEHGAEVVSRVHGQTFVFLNRLAV